MAHQTMQRPANQKEKRRKKIIKIFRLFLGTNDLSYSNTVVVQSIDQRDESTSLRFGVQCQPWNVFDDNCVEVLG